MVLKIDRLLKIHMFLLLVLIASACQTDNPLPTAAPVITTPSPQPVIDTPIPSLPTPTLIPLAVLINGEGISLQEYQQELDRYRSAAEKSGMNMATDEEQYVLRDMVNQVLLAQAAAEAGFLVDQQTLDSRLEQLTAELGGVQALENWLVENGYTEEGFYSSLSMAMAAAWMRDEIINSVPELMDQVHARQVLLYDEETAQIVLNRLSSGLDFEDLAYEYDPVLGGDLGWFPKGYLAQAALDEAVFSLEAGETSPVIETELGFHIVQVVEKAVQRPLSPDARLGMQIQALQNWLEQRRSQSDIQVLIP
jgi:peptidyl-prolyl cis-trans isomerase C